MTDDILHRMEHKLDTLLARLEHITQRVDAIYARLAIGQAEQLECKQCGHKWVPRKPAEYILKCANRNCQSHNWRGDR